MSTVPRFFSALVSFNQCLLVLLRQQLTPVPGSILGDEEDEAPASRHKKLTCTSDSVCIPQGFSLQVGYCSEPPYVCIHIYIYIVYICMYNHIDIYIYSIHNCF